jgi:hypothetical protein
MIKWISVLAAASLAAAPAAAQPLRISAPVAGAEAAGDGDHTFAWVMAVVMVVGAILILTDDDDGPESP